MSWEPPIEIVEGSEHLRFLALAYDFAMKHSSDKRTKVGAIIVQDNIVLGKGANHYPEDLIVTPELESDREWKKKNIIHAERAAKRQVGDVRGKKEYVIWTPCDPCAVDIIESGISEVYCHYDLVARTPLFWQESCGVGVERLQRSNVKLYAVPGKIGGIEHIFNGERWNP
jgi:deoxycytidylate deaminase